MRSYPKKKENFVHEETVYFGKEGLVNARISRSARSGSLGLVSLYDYLEINLINSTNPQYNIEAKEKVIYRMKCNETQLIQ